MRTLTIQSLDMCRIAQCFPLVQLTEPGLTAQVWTEFASSHLRSQQREGLNGILVAQVDERCILGLVVYQLDCHLAQGRTLLVKSLIAHDYFKAGRTMVELALIGAVEDLARKHNCQAVQVSMPIGAADLRALGVHEALESQGHKVNCLSYCKHLRDQLRAHQG